MGKVNKGKATKILSESFVANHKDINEDDAGALVVTAEQKVRKLTDERDNDDKLNAARQIALDLSSGYNAAIKYERAKINFLLDKIEEIQKEDLETTEE